MDKNLIWSNYSFEEIKPEKTKEKSVSEIAEMLREKMREKTKTLSRGLAQIEYFDKYSFFLVYGTGKKESGGIYSVNKTFNLIYNIFDSLIDTDIHLYNHNGELILYYMDNETWMKCTVSGFIKDKKYSIGDEFMRIIKAG